MPKFILDTGDKVSRQLFGECDPFTRGYLEAMFFTECHSDNPELDGASLADLALQTWDRTKRDCATFQADNVDTLAKAYAMQMDNGLSYDEECAGRDFWYSRNGHGVGFWDRGLGIIGDALHGRCRHRTVDLCRGDDGLLYLS